MVFCKNLCVDVKKIGKSRIYKNMKTGFFRSRALKVDILSAFSLLIFLTVICEILYSSFATKNFVLDFEKEYYSRTVVNSTTKRLDDYFKNLEVLLSMLQKSIGQPTIKNAEKQLEMFLESLRSSGPVISAYIGLPDGSFYQATKISETEKLQTKTSETIPTETKFAIRKIDNAVENDEQIETWTYVGDKNKELLTESLKTQYDPTKRAWYVQAQLANGIYWSDVYMLRISNTFGQTFGVTVSAPVDSHNTKNGVIGLAITLDNFKNILIDAKASKNTECYLVNSNEEIVSSSDEGPFLKTLPDGSQKLLSAIESKNERLKEAVKLLYGTKGKNASFSLNGETYACSFSKLSKVPFSILTISPEKDFIGNLSAVQYSMIMISIIIFLLSLIVIYFVSRRISNPMIALCNSAQAIGNLDFDNYPKPPKSAIKEIQKLSDAIKSMKISITTFSKYAPKDLVKKMVQLGITPKLGGKSEKVTLFFSDIENFSTVAERLPAEYLILHLSEYFNELTQEIVKNGGVIDKYIGDSIMAIWGAPNYDEKQAIHACEAALSCQKLLQKLKEKWTPLGKPPLPTRIGIHSGEAIVGNIGSQDRMNFTAIGDTINLASRLESVNKFYGTYILVSEAIEKEAHGQILFRVIDRIAVKGKTEAITIYEPLGSMSDADNTEYYSKIELSSKSKEAFDSYQKKNFQNAIEAYNMIISNFPEAEKSISVLKNRCEELLKNCPEDWDGVFYMDKK